MCKTLVADAIVSAIEDLVHKGKVTSSESFDYYMLLGNSLSLPDLIPTPIRLEALPSSTQIRRCKMNTGVILIKNKDQVIPEAYLKMVQKEYPSLMGLATVVDGKLLSNSTSIKEGVIDPESISDTQTELKDKTIVFFLGKTDHEPLDDDKQPYTLLSTNAGDALVVGFLTGEFPGLYQIESTKSDKFFLAEEFLKPTFEKNYNLVGQDFTKFVDDLRTKLTQLSIHAQMGEGSCITLLLHTGELLTFKKNIKTTSTFPWGHTSNTLGYTEVPPKSEEPPKTNKLSLTGKPKTVPIIAQKEPVLDKQPTTATAIPANAGDEFIMIFPPPGMKDHKLIQKWYDKHCGHKPSDWKNKPAVKVKKTRAVQILKSEGAIKEFSDLRDYLLDAGQLGEELGPVVYPSGVSPKGVEKPASTLASRPIIPPDQLKKLLEMKFISAAEKVTDANSNVITPESMKDDAKHPTFCEAAGIKGGLREVAKWEFSSFSELGDSCPNALAVLAFDAMRNYCKLYDDKLATVPKKEEAPIRNKLSLKVS